MLGARRAAERSRARVIDRRQGRDHHRSWSTRASPKSKPPASRTPSTCLSSPTPRRCCERIPRRKSGVQYRGICTTPQGASSAPRAVRPEGFGVDELAFVISASEAHNRANVDMGHDENKRAARADGAPLARCTGHQVFGWVLTSFGCPITGDVPVEDGAGAGAVVAAVGALTSSASATPPAWPTPGRSAPSMSRRWPLA
jgi:hypothetical protein